MSDIGRSGHRRERVDDILVVTFGRPPVHAFDTASDTAASTTLAEADTDPGVRATMLTGDGDSAFSDGTDLAERRRPG